MSDYVIKIKEVCKTYKMGEEELRVLDNVSVNIKRGEFVAIVGPSGSGKSTFMNVIGCLDTPDVGEYLLDGRNVGSLNDDQLSEIRNKKIGFIFQQFNLLGKLSAFENVELPLIYQGIPASARKDMVLGALRKVGLESRKDHIPNQLSGGQQQRVAIARAIVTDPQILLADEPTGALDSKTSKEILNIMNDLNKEGRTIVMITHDEGIAKQSERQIHIRDGKLYE